MATAVTACARHPEVGFRCAVLLDGWMFPIDAKDLQPPVSLPPMLYANTHTFQWTANVERMREGQTLDSSGRCAYDSSLCILKCLYP